MRDQHHPQPTSRSTTRGCAEILANPGFGSHFTDHMFTVEWTPDAGLARRPDHAVRPAHARPGDRGPALRAGDLRGHEGLPPRRRLGLDVPARGERRADGALQRSRLALPELPVEDFVAGRRRAGRGRPALGAGRGGGEEPLPAAVHVRLRGVPRRAARPARHLHGDRLARPAPTSRAASSRSRSGSPRTTPAPAAAAWARPRPAATTPARWSPSRRRPSTAATRWSSSTRQEGRYVEELGGMNMYFVYDDGRIVTPDDRHDPRGHHPRLDHRARRQARPPGRGAPVLHRRVARRRRPAARSPRSSPAAPPPSSRRSAR